MTWELFYWVIVFCHYIYPNFSHKWLHPVHNLTSMPFAHTWPCRRCNKCALTPVGKIPEGGNNNPTPSIFLPENAMDREASLVGYSPRGQKELDSDQPSIISIIAVMNTVFWTKNFNIIQGHEIPFQGYIRFLSDCRPDIFPFHESYL